MKRKLLIGINVSAFALQMVACGKEADVQVEETAEVVETTDTTETAEETGKTELANPWQEITEDLASQLVPNGFSAPEGATNVVWRAMGNTDPSSFEVPGPLVEMDFDLDGMSYTAREQIVGVSSDEELEYMIKFQNAFNTSSGYIIVVSEMLEHVVTALGS